MTSTTAVAEQEARPEHPLRDGPDRTALLDALRTEVRKARPFPVAERTLTLIAQAALGASDRAPYRRVIDRLGAPRFHEAAEGESPVRSPLADLIGESCAAAIPPCSSHRSPSPSRPPSPRRGIRPWPRARRRCARRPPASSGRRRSGPSRWPSNPPSRGGRWPSRPPGASRACASACAGSRQRTDRPGGQGRAAPGRAGRALGRPARRLRRRGGHGGAPSPPLARRRCGGHRRDGTAGGVRERPRDAGPDAPFHCGRRIDPALAGPAPRRPRIPAPPPGLRPCPTT